MAPRRQAPDTHSDGSALATPGTALVLGVATIVLVRDRRVRGGSTTAERGRRRSIVLVPGFGLVGFIVGAEAAAEPDRWVLLGAARSFSRSTARPRATRCSTTGTTTGTCRSAPVAVLLQPAWAPAIVLFALSIMLFPDGEPAARAGGGFRSVRSSSSARSGSSARTAIAIDAIASHRIHDRLDREPAAARITPTGRLGLVERLRRTSSSSCSLRRPRWLVGRIPAYRRATGVRRAQLKWLIVGAGTALVGGVAHGRRTSGVFGVVGFVGTSACSALPLSIGVGILRYRLYEIDRLISRTLSYALLTGLLVGVFAGLVLLTTRVLPFS